MTDVRVGWEALQAFTAQVFARAGMPEQDAATEAEVLVWANLRGIDSHGVLRIPSYLRSVEAGGMNPRPNIQIVKETAATTLIDADHAFGPVVTVYAMSRSIEKARQAGIGWTEIRNTTHQGAMGYYSSMAARANMAGIAIVCNPPNMAPFGARAAGVHNSPISIAVPGMNHRPLVLDIATSIAAGGKVQLAVDKGVSIPDGWALTKDGRPTNDPREAVVLMPFGGYKGSGMAMLFECLTSVMVGNPLLSTVLLGMGALRPGTQNSAVAAIDIAAFCDPDVYRENVDCLVQGIKSLPTAEGFEEVLVPGEVEDRVHEERARLGVPLPEGTANNLRAVAERLGVPLPPGL